MVVRFLMCALLWFSFGWSSQQLEFYLFFLVQIQWTQEVINLKLVNCIQRRISQLLYLVVGVLLMNHCIHCYIQSNRGEGEVTLSFHGKSKQTKTPNSCHQDTAATS